MNIELFNLKKTICSVETRKKERKGRGMKRALINTMKQAEMKCKKKHIHDCLKRKKKSIDLYHFPLFNLSKKAKLPSTNPEKEQEGIKNPLQIYDITFQEKSMKSQEKKKKKKKKGRGTELTKDQSIVTPGPGGAEGPA